MSGALTIDRWLRDRAQTTPSRVAIDYLGREASYTELDKRSTGSRPRCSPPASVAATGSRR